MQVFISWSGLASKSVATALRECILTVFGDRVHPWLSADDISAGVRWTPEVERQLARSAAGILCVTPENLASPWVLFEAGALARTAFLCPYLVGVNPSQLPSPVQYFQAKTADVAGTRDLLQALNRVLVPKESLTEEEFRTAFTTAWPGLAYGLSNVPQRAIDQPIIVRWPTGDVPSSDDLVKNAQHSLLLLGVSNYRVVCGRELYPFIDWLKANPNRHLGLLFLNPSSPHAQGRDRLDVWQSDPACTREALATLKERLQSEPEHVRERCIVGIREGPHRYSARAADLRQTGSPHAGIEVFVSSGGRGQARGLRVPISQQEQPTCFRYFETELLHEFHGALTNTPGHGISLVARWADPPDDLEALVADALKLDHPRAKYDFYETAQWHATISSLCRTQRCPWDESLSLGQPPSERHLPEHFPHFVQQATTATQARCKELTLTFHEAFLDTSGYMGVRGTMDHDHLDAILNDILHLVNEYAQRYPQESWLAPVTSNEPRFGPKYPTFLPHVTLGRAYVEHVSFPVPLRTSARLVTLPEPVTFRTDSPHLDTRGRRRQGIIITIQILRIVVRDVIAQAEERQKSTPGMYYAGAVLQHLVGAKLDCALGKGHLNHNSFSTADAPGGRAGDFFLGDVAIHVTTSPGEALIGRCRDNLNDGYRPILVTLQRGLTVAEGLATNVDLAERIDVFEIEQFVALNLYELAKFALIGPPANRAGTGELD